MQIPMSEDLNNVYKQSANIAAKLGNDEIGTEHFLYAVTKVNCIARKILEEEGIDEERLQHIFPMPGIVMDIRTPNFSARMQQMLIESNNIRREFNQNQVTVEEVLFCIFRSNDGLAVEVAKLLGANVRGIAEKLLNVIKGATHVGNTNETLPAQLKDLGIDLTQKARDGKIEPVIGRKEEIERIVEILCRKTKNNPVLIGEPGVGKSAVVEGLALAIANGTVPDILKNKTIFSLNLGNLMAGTKYRGALEEKLKDMIELVKSQPNIILFIDEMHALATAGSEKGEVTPADMLKPYLARGELQTIGATTTDEYRKFIEKDKALERRFQTIIVNPPSTNEAMNILYGLRENYEKFHKVKLTDEAIETAVNLSERYITDRFLPDKAIDVIDEAMSKAKVANSQIPLEIKKMEEELDKALTQKENALKKDDFECAKEMRDKANKIKEELAKRKLAWSNKKENVWSEINAEDIAKVVSAWTKIPVTRLNETEKERLLKLEEILAKRVVGQEEAVKSVARAIRRSRAGLQDPKKPIGSFMFLGPTGVGKTELTKALCEAMFDDENNIIRVDMSEYMESHSVSKLIGSPPGYVGHDDGGQLTEQVRRKPYSVILFDEIEKAHPDVFNILLQILDDGRLTDSHGRTVNFKNTIIIMTSNVGVDMLKNTVRNLGFSDKSNELKNDEVLMKALKDKFKPEFLNRISVICIFHSLNIENLRKIAAIMIDKVRGRLKEKGIDFDIDNKAVDFLINNSYDIEYGARPLSRKIETEIEDKLAEKMIAGKLNSGDKIIITANKDQILFK